MMGGTVSVQVLQEKEEINQEESPYDRTNSNIDTIILDTLETQ